MLFSTSIIVSGIFTICLSVSSLYLSYSSDTSCDDNEMFNLILWLKLFGYYNLIIYLFTFILSIYGNKRLFYTLYYTSGL